MAFEDRRDAPWRLWLNRVWRARKSFAVNLAVRLGAILLAMCATAFFVTRTDYVAAPMTCGVLAALLCVSLWRYLYTGNRETARFLAALRHGDMAQTFSAARTKVPYPLLLEEFSGALERVRESRAAREEEAATLRSLLEHVPVALAARDADGSLELLNTAARRLFAGPGPVEAESLAGYGTDLTEALDALQPGQTRIVRVTLGDTVQRMKLSLTQVTLRRARRSLIALENIQSELDATELGAWNDLVRVLTHEMMNSLTPISSLAETAHGLLEDQARSEPAAAPDPAKAQAAREEALADVGEALTTIARRSEGLLRFVEAYRRLTKVPDPKRMQVTARTYLERLVRLFEADFKARSIALDVVVEPRTLEFLGDAELLDQAMINLLRNAAEAVEGCDAPRIELGAGLDRAGRAYLKVADNGVGLSAEDREKIFVPFFTTKPRGSGVGLSVVRQVAAAHGGSITVAPRTGGGTVFTLTIG